jgi:tetratricopeptide (TPR) repeat protein
MAIRYPARRSRRASASRATHVASLVVALALPSAPSHAARASDFWEDVRDPGLPAYRADVRRAEVAYRARRYPEALAFAEHARGLRDDLPEAPRLQGLALGAMGHVPDAIAALERALALDPAAFDDAMIGAEAAHIAVRGEAWALAAAILERAVAAMPPSPSRRAFYAEYGDVLLTLGPAHLEASVRAYEVALRDGGGHDARAALGLALALHRAGRRADAERRLDEVRRAIRVEGVLASVAGPLAERNARRALLHEAAGRRSEALAAWEAAAERPEWAEHARAQIARLGGEAPR